MNRILKTVENVTGSSKHVSIDYNNLDTFADSITSRELKGIQPLFEKDDNLSLEQSIAFGFVYNAVNFSYWGEPKWVFTVNGEDRGGGIGMLYALKQAVGNGYNLLSAEYLSNMSLQDITYILQANVEIPLLKERLSMLRSLGAYISSGYNGSFTAFVERANWDAVKLVEMLADEMPDVFNDEETYNGSLVRFYKRAQLVPSHLHELWLLGVSERDMTNLDKLTALADYKVPQVLRKYGVIQYDTELTQKIDSEIELANGSDEEIEIRAVTVWAVELLTQRLNGNGIKTNALEVDHALWFRGRQKLADDRPYHRTRTVWY